MTVIMPFWHIKIKFIVADAVVYVVGAIAFWFKKYIFVKIWPNKPIMKYCFRFLWAEITLFMPRATTCVSYGSMMSQRQASEELK